MSVWWTVYLCDELVCVLLQLVSSRHEVWLGSVVYQWRIVWTEGSRDVKLSADITWVWVHCTEPQLLQSAISHQQTGSAHQLSVYILYSLCHSFFHSKEWWNPHENWPTNGDNIAIWMTKPLFKIQSVTVKQKKTWVWVIVWVICRCINHSMYHVSNLQFTTYSVWIICAYINHSVY